MADVKQAGVGGFGDLGTHGLDMLMWLMGDVAAVTADIKIVTARYPDCDESGEGMLKFKNGVTGTLAAGWVDLANPMSLMVSGTEGHIAVINGQVYYRSDKAKADGKTAWKDLPKGLPHPLDMFLDAVAGKPAAMLVTPREAASRSAVMEAMYIGSREGKWVVV